MITNILETYKVDIRSDKPVELKVVIGNGQLGFTSANLGEVKILNEEEGNIKCKIGKGSEIDKKSLFVTTMVKDIQPATNKTEVTYKLTNGISPYTQLLKKESLPGGVVFYVAYFIFYS